MTNITPEELQRRFQLCAECMSELCAFNPEGVCRFPLVYGREPSGYADDDGCKDFCMKNEFYVNWGNKAAGINIRQPWITEKEKENEGKMGKGVGFERIRRITGYLVGDAKTRFNDAKLAELRDRKMHSLTK